MWDAAGICGISGNSWVFWERISVTEHLWYLIFLPMKKKKAKKKMLQLLLKAAAFPAPASPWKRGALGNLFLTES